MNSPLAILLFSALTTNGLFALWAATSRRGWFWRTSLCLGFLAPLLLIPAYEPLIALVLQAAVIVAAVQLKRWRQQWRATALPVAASSPRWRISLLSMLQVTTILGVVAAVAARTPELNRYAWQSIIAIGLCSGASLSLALWASCLDGSRRVIAIGAAIVVAAGLGVLLGFLDFFVLSSLGGGWVHEIAGLGLFVLAYDRDATSFIAEWVWVLPGSVLAVLCVRGAWLATVRAITAPRSLTARVCLSVILAASIGLVATPALRTLWLLSTPEAIPVAVLPSPNGFDELMAAQEMLGDNLIIDSGSFDRDAASPQQLADAVSEVRAPIERSESALQSPVMRLLDYHSLDALDVDSIQARRSMVRGMDAAGRLAEVQGDETEALRWYLNCVRHGFASRRGGLIVDDLVGTACIGIGLSGVYELRDRLSNQQREATVEIIGELLADVEPIEEVERRDRVWTQRAMGWMAHLGQLLESEEDDPGSYRMPRLAEAAKCRLMMLELALETFKSSQGRFPDQLSDLALASQPGVVVDPFSPTEESFVYRPVGDGYALYSVGGNGVDDNGAAPDDGLAAWASPSGDLSLEGEFNPQPQGVGPATAGGDKPTFGEEFESLLDAEESASEAGTAVESDSE
ncbi:hypothetical protein [Lacipirellula sp.]|uniref:hypothetical protein n=1 Tax=Lacipirellula sp. TaxID=2691419 RepID=UPI003D0FDB8F